MLRLAPPPHILNQARSLSLDPRVSLRQLLEFLDDTLDLDFSSGERGPLAATFFLHLGTSISDIHTTGLSAVELFPDGRVSLEEANERWHATRDARRAQLQSMDPLHHAARDES